MTKILLGLSILFAHFISAQNHDYHSQALEKLEAGNYRSARELATKAIEQEPANTDYRWTRARASMTTSSSEEDFARAVEDLNVIVNSGKATEQTYFALGTAEAGMANKIYRFRSSDDDARRRKNFGDAVKHYELAVMAFRKSEKARPEASQNIKDCEAYIAEIRPQIK